MAPAQEPAPALIQFPLFIFLQTRFLKKKIYRRVLCIWAFSPDGQYLNNRVSLSRNYWLIVAQQKFDVLKTNTCPRSQASRANMLVLRTLNFQGATIRPIVPRHFFYFYLFFYLFYFPLTTHKDKTKINK